MTTSRKMTGKKIKLLIVEDNDFDFELVERKLQSLDYNFEYRRVLTATEFKTLLDEFCPDLILSDFSLPSFSGLEALKIAKTYCPSTPFIFVSGTIGEELAVETLKQGANDYVLKDNLNKLQPAIHRALREANEIERRKEAETNLNIKVNELKTLIYRISHDIRGPISTIKGAVNLVQHTDRDNVSEVVTYVELIGQVARKMEGIVTNLSSFQFIYADEIKAINIDIDDFLQKLKISVAEIEGYEDVNLQICKKGLRHFYFEHNLLFTILFNLIHNAIVFIDKTKPVSKISCDINVSEQNIQICVEDNGLGISTAIQDKVFDMFFRGSSLSRGAGLGLYITKNIVDQFNGRISLQSQEMQGTKLLIIIPNGLIGTSRNWANN